MSRWIVNQRPFSRKKRKHSLKKKLNRSGISIPEFNISQKLRNILSWWLVFTILIVGWIIVLVKSLLFQPTQKIAQVKFSDGTLATYQNPYLFGFISDSVKWKNYYLLKKDEILSKIQKWFSVKNLSWENIQFKFPFVWDIAFQLEYIESATWSNIQNIAVWMHLPKSLPITKYDIVYNQFPLRSAEILPDSQWILWIEISYLEPKLLVNLNNKKFAVWTENVFAELTDNDLLSKTKIDPNSDDNTINNLTEIFTIQTPKYLSWTDSLDWFFFDINLAKFLQIVSLIQEEFWTRMSRCVYLVWSTRFAVFTNDQKTLYFNFPEWADVLQQREAQIFKYNTLKEKHPKFDKIRTIDLWALENNNVIIKFY